MTEQPPRPISGGRSAALGVAYSAAAYVLWGLFPIYFKAVASVPATEMLAHRIVWSLVFLCALTAIRRSWGPIVAALSNTRLLATLMLSAATIAVNWGIFIWAIAADRVLECSLGYFIGPLVSVLLGVVILHERLTRGQWLAVALATMGVAYQTVVQGSLPWVALTLAISFASYGLLRKVAPVDAIGGLVIEALLLTPPALGLLLFLTAKGQGAFAFGSWHIDVLLVLAGPVTALPLILFVAGARRIRLATVGLLQYITPTGHFLLAVTLFDERLSLANVVAFACIWLALGIYTADLLRRSGR